MASNRRETWLGILAQLGVNREECENISSFRKALNEAWERNEQLRQQFNDVKVDCWRSLFGFRKDDKSDPLTQTVFDATRPHADVDMGGGGGAGDGGSAAGIPPAPAHQPPPPPPTAADPLADLVVKATRIVAEMDACGDRAQSAAQEGNQRFYEHHMTNLMQISEVLKALDESLLVRLNETVVDPARVVAFQTDVQGAKARLTELRHACIRAWDVAVAAKKRELDELDRNVTKAQVVARLYTSALAQVTGDGSGSARAQGLLSDGQCYNNFSYLMDD